jgi:peptidoglycan/LPS O-acetylase OafA/YrhL
MSAAMSHPGASKRWLADLAGQPGRYPVLDSLRALAIVLVLLRHWAVAAHDAFGSLAGGPLATLAMNGWLGVDLFFVLSGFLIASHFTGPQAANFDRQSILNFYRRRAFRTLPLYWGVILLGWLAAALWAWGAGFSSTSFSVHFLFLQDYLGSDVLITLWSLAVEEKFYLLAPLLLGLLLKAGWRLASVALALMMACSGWSLLEAARAVEPGNYSDFFWSVRAPFHHSVYAILAGVLVAVLHGARRVARAPHWLFAGSSIALGLLLGLRDWTTAGQWPVTAAVITLSAGLFALLVWSGLAINLRHPDFGATRFLRRIAKLSYALYLVHYPLLGPATRASQYLLGANATPALSAALFMLVYLCLSWACAWLLHVALEKPFLMLRDRARQTAPVSALTSCS